MSSESVSQIELQSSWKGKPVTLTINASSNILDVKRLLEEITHVRVERQKLIGLNVGGKQGV